MTSPDTEFISILGASGHPEAPARVSSSSLPEVLPILGLSDIVIFPGMVAPLLVETAQSTKLIDDVVGGNRLLGVVLQRNPEAENPLPHELYDVGCAARVLKMLKFPGQHGPRAGGGAVADQAERVPDDRALRVREV
jgi:ATP-dependent Lon protease